MTEPLNPWRTSALVADLAAAPVRLAAFVADSSVAQVFVACSGGIDSMVLAERMVAAQHVAAEPFAVCLLHVNYGLRGADSADDATFVAQWAATRNVECRILSADSSTSAGRRCPGEGTQEWARRVRFEWFQTIVGAGALVALAHHGDDLAENFVYRLARGGAPGRLGGMTPLDGSLWRPLLGLFKADIRAFATRQHLPHRHDSSNDTIVYSRNRVRHTVMPVLEELHRGAGAKIAALALEAEALQRWCDGRLVADFPPGPRLAAAALRALPPGMGVHALAAFFRREGATGLSRRLLYAVLDRLDERGTAPWQEQLPGGGAVRIDEETVSYIRTPP